MALIEAFFQNIKLAFLKNKYVYCVMLFTCLLQGIFSCTLPHKLEEILRFTFCSRKAVQETIEELLFKKFPFMEHQNAAPGFPKEIRVIFN